MLLYADDLVLLAPGNQSLESALLALLVLYQVARKWGMPVNCNKTIGVVVTPPTATAMTTAASPMGPNRMEIQGHFKYLGSITVRGAGP